jgi:predicted Mrr-cat superfamily restriction endonuclease
MGSKDYGLFVSTGGFTSDAIESLKSEIFSKITLWDLEKFFDLWVINYEKLSK